MVEHLARRVAWALGLALFLFAFTDPGFAAAPESAGERDSVVIVVSMDGVRHDYLDRGGLPALERIASQGVRAPWLTPVFPASTFTNHVSLATGAHADRHGIVGNRFRDPERGEFDYSNDASFIDAEPIWIAGSETAWRDTAATYRKAPFDSGIGEAEKVDQILAWLDLPEAERPRLILSWWHGADSAGHRHGPDSDKTTAALRGQDRELVRLLEGLDQRRVWAHTTLLVVSDHGMVAVTRAIDAVAPLEAAGIRARAILGASYALVSLEDPSQRAAAVAALSAVEGVRAYPADAVPEALRFRHPSRTGDVVALTEPPRAFTKPWSQRAGLLRLSRWFGNAVGAHGYDPATHPEMRGVFLALGRGVRQLGVIPPVRAVDVAPTIAHLLAIDPPAQAEGTPISALSSARSAP
jgi:predicted AlkP superfamily pyrophosphatase or phosphodiesterase